MKLKVKWKRFYSQVSDYLNEAEDMLSLKPEYCSLISHDCISSAINSWINKCYNLLKNSFDSPNNIFAESFCPEKSHSLHLTKEDKKAPKELKLIFQNLYEKKTNLKRSLRLLSVSDAFIQPNLVDLQVREKYNLNEIVELLFDKLYYLYDSFYYPIQAIIKGNGIKLFDYAEFTALITKYETEGYISLIKARNIYGRLTKKGKDLEEKKRTFDFITKVHSNQEEVIDQEQVDLYEDLNTAEAYNFMIRELKNLKLLNSIIFEKNTNDLVKVG